MRSVVQKRAARFAFFEDEHDARVAIGGDRFGNGVGVEIDRCASFVEQEAVEVERYFRGIELHACVTGGRNDAAPVRIGAGDRRFHERAVGDCFADLERVRPVAAAVDFDGDEVRGAFAVGGNRLGQVFADFEERGAEVFEAFAGQRVRADFARSPRRWRAGAPCRSCSCGHRR